MASYINQVIVRSKAGLGCSSDFREDNRETSSEQYMMYELLYLSLQDLVSKNYRDREEALEWFDSEEEDYCFSFKSLAETLGTSAERIRKDIINPAMMGNQGPLLRITKFAKVNRKGVLYEE